MKTTNVRASGYVTIKVKFDTEFDVRTVSQSDLDLPDLDTDEVITKFQEAAEEEFGFMFDDEPLSIEAHLEDF